MTTEAHLPQHESAEQLARSAVEQVAHAESLNGLATAFGEEIPEDLDTTGRLGWLHDFSRRHFDARAGKERGDTNFGKFTPEQEQAVMALTEEFTMIGDTDAPGKPYDFVITVGGSNQANLLRTRKALQQAELVHSRGYDMPHIVQLAGSRLIKQARNPKNPDVPSEAENIQNFAPGALEAETAYGEFDAMNKAVVYKANQAGLTVEQQDDGLNPDERGDVYTPEGGRMAHLRLSNGVEVFSVEAPGYTDKDRSTSDSTMQIFADILSHDGGEQPKNILLATTDIFSKFQYLSALRLIGLPTGASIDVVSYGLGESGKPGEYGGRKPSVYAQEFVSIFSKAQKLWAELQEQQGE